MQSKQWRTNIVAFLLLLIFTLSGLHASIQNLNFQVYHFKVVSTNTSSINSCDTTCFEIVATQTEFRQVPRFTRFFETYRVFGTSNGNSHFLSAILILTVLIPHFTSLRFTMLLRSRHCLVRRILQFIHHQDGKKHSLRVA